MNQEDAEELIRAAIPRVGGVWADLGAGEGTFTRALVHVAAPSRVYAVDRDRGAVAKLRRWASKEAPNVVPIVGDFTLSMDWSDEVALDGILLANALHYVRDPAGVLRQLVARLRPGGLVVIAEYDHRAANRWVPYPIPSAEWPTLARAAGLSNPRITASRPSAFGGDLYVAVADLC